MQFQSLVNTANLTQHILEPTHIHGHILDLIITHDTSSLIEDVAVSDPGLSDHFAVSCYINLTQPHPERKTILYRKWRSLDMTKFKDDLKNSSLTMTTDENDDVDHLVTLFDSTLRDTLDNHIPLKKRTFTVESFTIKPKMPWFNDEMQSAYQKNRSIETALLHVPNDILLALDQRKAVILALLDLSAAFDTVTQPHYCSD